MEILVYQFKLGAFIQMENVQNVLNLFHLIVEHVLLKDVQFLMLMDVKLVNQDLILIQVDVFFQTVRLFWMVYVQFVIKDLILKVDFVEQPINVLNSYLMEHVKLVQLGILQIFVEGVSHLSAVVLFMEEMVNVVNVLICISWQLILHVN